MMKKRDWLRMEQNIPFSYEVASHLCTMLCILKDTDVDYRLESEVYMVVNVKGNVYTIYLAEDGSLRLDVPVGNPDESIIRCIETFFSMKRIGTEKNDFSSDNDEEVPFDYYVAYERDD
jgi:hypothetical protein